MSVGTLFIYKKMHVMSVLRSIPLMESIGSHVMIDDTTANLKNVYIWTAKNQAFIYLNFIKIGRGHKIGQSVTRPFMP